MLIDTHAHLNFNAYKDDADEVIRRSLDNNVWMINVGSKYETSKRAAEMAQKYPDGVFATVGLHPLHLETKSVKIKIDLEEVAFNAKEEEFDYGKYKELAQNSKVIAIGEVGLDYYYKPKTKKKLAEFKEKQRTVLCQQLKLAEELNLPIIFHCRMAHGDLIEILKSEILNPKSETNSKSQIQNSKPRGVMHGFVGTTEQLKEYLDMGFYIGFNGIIFKKIEGIDFEENIKAVPLEKILIETDCPYLTPPLPAEALLASLSLGKGGVKAGPKEGRNEPLYIKYVAQKIAEIKNIDFEKVAEITTQNARYLFKI